jgi:hypothetical protein
MNATHLGGDQEANKITGPNAGGPRQFPILTPLAARVGQFWRSATMAAAMNQQVVDEIAPTVRALTPHGFELVATEGAGMMFWAEFRRQSTTFRLVKDRGFWSIDCAGVLGASRKSQSAAIRDALDWLSKNVA